MNNSSQEFLESIIRSIVKSGISIDLHVSVGQPQTYIEETNDEMIASDLGSQPATHQETDLYFGFSSPAGKQYYDDDELKGKR